VPRVPGERGRVGGGGGSYRRPGSPRRVGPREEARVCGRHGGAAGAVGPRLGADPRKGMTPGVPPVGDTRGKAVERAGWANWAAKRWAARLIRRAGPQGG
jgi:hypothetical protein